MEEFHGFMANISKTLAVGSHEARNFRYKGLVVQVEFVPYSVQMLTCHETHLVQDRPSDQRMVHIFFDNDLSHSTHAQRPRRCSDCHRRVFKDEQTVFEIILDGDDYLTSCRTMDVPLGENIYLLPP
jgi:hypothetical protein